MSKQKVGTIPLAFPNRLNILPAVLTFAQNLYYLPPNKTFQTNLVNLQ
jgi:hypothetical protein